MEITERCVAFAAQTGIIGLAESITSIGGFVGGSGDASANRRSSMSYQLYHGDCLETLKTFASESINCCVTSPPYFGLRDYGVDGQIGMEHTPDDFVNSLVTVFREVRRVLKDDGTLWVNLGDSYSAHKDCKSIGQSLAKGTTRENAHVIEKSKNRTSDSKMLKSVGLKNKDLIGIPWMVAFALRADGWYLRSDIIWSKPNPMPESVRDRPTKSHEYIFLLSKSQHYYYDAEAIKEVAIDGGGRKDNNPENRKRFPSKLVSGVRDGTKSYSHRNKRSVWTVSTKPYKEAHFATYPPDLILPCILAGCPEGGTVLDPFNGSGTTGQVALQNNRNYIGIELNAEYIQLTERRLEGATYQPSLFTP